MKLPYIRQWGLVAALLCWSAGTASAALGDSQAQIEMQYGTPAWVQAGNRQLLSWSDWQKRPQEFKQQAAAFGYAAPATEPQAVHWIHYDENRRVDKETVLLAEPLRLHVWQERFTALGTALKQGDVALFRRKMLQQEQLTALLPQQQVDFFVVPDGTRLNMHSQLRGWEITPRRAKNEQALWQRIDNYFQDTLYFSEPPAKREVTDMLVIHHTALDAMSLADIHMLHLSNGWSGIGYHKVVLPDGQIREGRPEQWIGAHALGVNQHSIGIVVDGDFSHKPPSEGQMQSLIKLTAQLMQQYHIPLDKVVPHREATPGTACPGEAFPWHEFKERLQAAQAGR